MYVRPYLEDPIWLQPDDDEMEMLYDQELEKQAKADEKDKTLPPKPPTHWEHHFHHDLPGDPDLENPDEAPEYDDPEMDIDTYHSYHHNYHHYDQNDLIEGPEYSDPHPPNERGEDDKNDLLDDAEYSDEHQLPYSDQH